MKLGVSPGSDYGSLPKALDAVASLGIRRVCVGQGILEGRSAADLRAVCQQSGVELATIYAHSTTILNPARLGPRDIGPGIAGLEAMLDLARSVGCRTLTIGGAHPGFTPDLEARLASRFKEVVECWTRAAPLLERYQVYLCLESGIHTSLYSPEQYQQLFERVGCEYLAITMDVVNMLSAEDYYDQHPKIDRLFRCCRGKVQVAHLKDITHEARLHTHLNEAAPGEGHLDWDYLLPLVDRALPDWSVAFVEHTPFAKLPASLEFVRTRAAACGVTIE